MLKWNTSNELNMMPSPEPLRKMLNQYSDRYKITIDCNGYHLYDSSLYEFVWKTMIYSEMEIFVNGFIFAKETNE